MHRWTIPSNVPLGDCPPPVTYGREIYRQDCFKIDTQYASSLPRFVGEPFAAYYQRLQQVELLKLQEKRDEAEELREKRGRIERQLESRERAMEELERTLGLPLSNRGRSDPLNIIPRRTADQTIRASFPTLRPCKQGQTNFCHILSASRQSIPRRRGIASRILRALTSISITLLSLPNGLYTFCAQRDQIINSWIKNPGITISHSDKHRLEKAANEAVKDQISEMHWLRAECADSFPFG
ncbi:hypothetical protein FN846DRAFT_306049 [Sphaerosporella brunnea]|uniref:Uncharacterized protein n=1 Tax=Sphaerosporella brunnea TaxID=1250544 RepID=A0A5J5F730_9PEZI|nr:hypothetical protein FN846DRAFT_306049 [Sphaerosporella brunnea]